VFWKPMCHPFRTSTSHMRHIWVILVPNCLFFWQLGSGRQGYKFMMSNGSKQVFGGITEMFSIASFLGVQIENNGAMLPKFRSNSWLVINPCCVCHSWVGLGPIIFYRYSDTWLVLAIYGSLVSFSLKCGDGWGLLMDVWLPRGN
jgi:hypothetical protein